MCGRCCTGEFYTDPQHVVGMQATWERWYITAFQALRCALHPFPCKCGAQGAYCGIIAPDLQK